MVDFQKAHDCLLIDSKFCPAEVGWACLGSHPHKTEINKRVGERTVRRSFLKKILPTQSIGRTQAFDDKTESPHSSLVALLHFKVLCTPI